MRAASRPTGNLRTLCALGIKESLSLLCGKDWLLRLRLLLWTSHPRRQTRRRRCGTWAITRASRTPSLETVVRQSLRPGVRFYR
jgi:hypothetical protein